MSTYTFMQHLEPFMSTQEQLLEDKRYNKMVARAILEMLFNCCIIIYEYVKCKCGLVISSYTCKYDFLITLLWLYATCHVLEGNNCSKLTALITPAWRARSMPIKDAMISQFFNSVPTELEENDTVKSPFPRSLILSSYQAW